jgi:hypothetical protein
MALTRAALTCALLTTAACSIPDGDDIEDLTAGIRGLPPGDQQTIVVNKENDRLWNIINGKSTKNDKIGTVTCKERDLPEFRNYARNDPIVTKSWMLQELRRNPSWGLAELFAEILRKFKPGPLGGNPCTPKFEAMPGGWKEEDLRAELDAAEQAEDDATDSAFWLPTLSSEGLKRRPVLMGVLGLVVVGGVVVISVTNPVILALCPKSEAIDCPSNPLNPGGSPLGPNGEPGGDR